MPDAGASDLRARVIDALTLTGSADAQRAYQRDVPIAQVPAEVLLQWPDWLVEDADRLAAFSADERRAILVFHTVWEAVSDRPDSYSGRYADEVLGTPDWERLVAAAATALTAF